MASAAAAKKCPRLSQPPIPRRADEPEVRLVDQGGGLERLAGPLPGQPMGGQPAKLVVDQREKLIGRLGLAFLDGHEGAGGVVHVRNLLPNKKLVGSRRIRFETQVSASVTDIGSV